MADHRLPDLVIHCAPRGKPWVSLELFAIEQWIDSPVKFMRLDGTDAIAAAGLGLFRLRIDGKWDRSDKGRDRVWTPTEIRNAFFLRIQEHFHAYHPLAAGMEEVKGRKHCDACKGTGMVHRKGDCMICGGYGFTIKVTQQPILKAEKNVQSE